MRRLGVVAVAVGSLAGLTTTATAAPQGFSCLVNMPISAAALNAGGTWSFEASGGTPGGTYWVKVNWPGDPSNGAHPNTSLLADETGHGATTLPARWAPDGSLPGMIDADGNFTAIPGDFSVQVYPAQFEPNTRGTTKCKGEVTA